MNHDNRDLCPYCHENVSFDELFTKTFIKNRQKGKAIVQRCPKCKRVVDLNIPISSQRNKNE